MPVIILEISNKKAIDIPLFTSDEHMTDLTGTHGKTLQLLNYLNIIRRVIEKYRDFYGA